MLVVPGMTMTFGLRRSSHARATCPGVAPSSGATSASIARGLRAAAPAGQMVWPPAVPTADRRCRAARSSRAPGRRRAREGCSDSARRRSARCARASSTCASVTLDSPTCRIFPSARSCASAPTLSANGTSDRAGAIGKARSARASIAANCLRKSVADSPGCRRGKSCPARSFPRRPLVATITPGGYGASASAMSSSFQPGP